MLAHIGTSANPKSKESIEAKSAWLTYLHDTDIKGVTGASPAGCFTKTEISGMDLIKGGHPQFFGYFAGGAAYAVLLYAVPPNEGPRGMHLHKVVAVKTMDMKPWSSIGVLDTFKSVIDPKIHTGVREIRTL
jgi:hypothetical protein